MCVPDKLHAPECARSPIMLSQNHNFMTPVELECHEKVFHSGVKETLNEFRNYFWISRSRNYIRKLLSTCFICKRLNRVPFHFKLAESIIWDRCLLKTLLR